jgi:hypothetical protein
MPYEGQKATGESLIALEQSKLFEEFAGEIRMPDEKRRRALQPTALPLASERITRVLAIDGSIVSEKIKNGFPGAEASLVQIALVSIDLNKLDEHSGQKIVPPRAFNQMDKAATLQCVLPGCNVAKSDGTAPKDFFRQSIYEALQGSVQKDHETLLETYRALVAGRTSTFRCPTSGCGQALDPGVASWNCPCSASVPRAFQRGGPQWRAAWGGHALS